MSESFLVAGDRGEIGDRESYSFADFGLIGPTFIPTILLKGELDEGIFIS